MLGADRATLREFYRTSWSRFEAGLPLEPLQALVADVIAEHPEYHDEIMAPDAASKQFTVEAGTVNPFLHMGMHIALREQVGTDRPGGLKAEYKKLLKAVGNQHETEHQMMECLGQVMWQAERDRQPPDERAFLSCVKRLRKAGRRR